MNYKLLEVLRNEKVQDEIRDLYCKLDKERFSEGSHMGSGWGWQIIVDENGEVDYMYNGFNNTRMDVHEGKATVIATLTDDAEVSTDSMGDIDFILDAEELEKFKSWIVEEFELDTESEDLEDEIWNNCTWSNYHEFNTEGYQAVELEAWEAICDNYSYDTITDRIFDTIQFMEERKAYYENFEQQQ